MAIGNFQPKTTNEANCSPVIAGIVAEFNPFHNGHAYLIRKVRESFHADRIYVAMSGNFVQRGLPAIVDKYTRTRMALKGGVDLIAEIPLIYATASAEYYAGAGALILQKLGCTHIAFGAECEDTDLLYAMADYLSRESDDYKEALKENLKKGLSYPAAREVALCCVCNEFSNKEIRDLFSGSNNILALEYLRAIRRFGLDLIPIIIRRQGSDYNDATLSDEYPSATALRALIRKDAVRMDDPSLTAIEGNALSLEDSIPEDAILFLEEAIRTNTIVQPDDLLSVIQYALLKEKDLTAFFDLSEDMEGRIRSLSAYPKTYHGLLDTLSCANLAKSRISRALMHVLLDIRQADADTLKSAAAIPYIRLLGIRKNTVDLGNLIKHADIPVFIRMAEATGIIDSAYSDLQNKKLISKDFVLSLFERECFANQLYDQIVNQKAGAELLNEFREPFISF